ncbi:hypothetical protein [Glycomyces buryatensis]|uniref:Uncharacterized protein n=1 Tax=Glycomyces buryatensis TaxID=2570927 RepID=A0A4V4HS00_9ACTN|nr:hypothetical protein [Glycomyces buryatensis]THV39686.1 hypothetical protein FAB82_17050 [Glycomyces buryatensis]
MRLLISRIVAVAVCAPLAAQLAFDADYRADNIFAIPDAIGCAVLLVSAVLPAKRAEVGLTAGLGYMGGVVMVAAFGRIDSGDTFNAVLNFVIAAVFTVLAAWHVHGFRRRGAGAAPAAG